MSDSFIDEEKKPSEETGGAGNGSGLRFPIIRGSSKRSLSLFSDISAPEVLKRSKMECKIIDEDMMMDELDDDLDEMPPSPSTPVPNFANSPVALRAIPRSTGTKKIAIKNFRKRGNSENNEAVEWKSLEDAVSAIHTHQSIQHSLEELYKMVTNVCTNEKASEMYDKLLALSKQHLTNDLNDKLIAVKDVSPVDFLRMVNQLWNNYCAQTLMIRNVFLYLDRTFILNRPEIMSIWDGSLNIFCEVIVNNPYVRERLVKDLISQIADERNGIQMDRPLIRSLLRMLSNLHIYEQVFEGAFIDSSRELYQTEGINLSRDLEITAYLNHVKRRLDEEFDRIQVYLDVGTKKPLISVVEETLITSHMKAFVSKGLDSLIDGDRLEDLTLLFKILDRVGIDGLTLLKTHFTDYIKKHGKAIVMDTNREKEMVPDLIKFKNKLDRIVSTCFGNNDKMIQSLKDSFDYCVNARQNKPAELIAKYIDMKLRSGNKEASDEELDQIMDKLITLFRFIHGKDVFEAFYKKDLAKRLLHSKSASVDAEKAMLCKLKQECGAGFTQRLEGMFKDMEMSKDLGIAFKKHTEAEAKERDEQLCSNAEFNISILTMGQWPNYEYAEATKYCSATLPKDLCLYLNAYQNFYVNKHNGRKLQWQHSLGHCLVKGTFGRGVTKELQVSLFQTMILLLFNDPAKKSWTLEEIEAETRIDKKELNRSLVSMACGRKDYRVLSKFPKGRDVEKGDRFEVNDQLSVNLYRIKINQVQLKETEEEHAQTEEQVNQDRVYAVDAAVVRVMKTRKMLSHSDLIQELFKQLRFPVNATDLKTRIASLMEREFITRDANDPNTYHYVA
ncbi:cul-4 [Pristionchus pacificus]|uniref:Cul-4 n=1 Tax=Pristionchus pacificus TaxID=54126 RepID=A0A2A6B4Z5_PRIPA|nr:cul-4 [Pristionchus pacificus]|eukprot:PDM60950.1 cul-4 [Pristionchus pacificus]